MKESYSKLMFSIEAETAGIVHFQQAGQTERRIFDPEITLFAVAMQHDGYVPELHNECLILRQCPNCKGSYSVKYIKNHLIFWACPSCKTITQGYLPYGLWMKEPQSRLVTDKGYRVKHVRGREVHSIDERSYFIVDDRGNLTEDDITDYVLGRLDANQVDRVEEMRKQWVIELTGLDRTDL